MMLAANGVGETWKAMEMLVDEGKYKWGSQFLDAASRTPFVNLSYPAVKIAD